MNIFFYEFIIRNYPSLYFSFWTTQFWIVFLFKWPFQILAHCMQTLSNYVFDENIKFFYFREGTSFFLCLMKIISFNSLHSEIITYINSSLQKWKRNFIIFATLYQIHYNDGVLSLKSDKIVLADRQLSSIIKMDKKFRIFEEWYY